MEYESCYKIELYSYVKQLFALNTLPIETEIIEV